MSKTSINRIRINDLHRLRALWMAHVWNFSRMGSVQSELEEYLLDPKALGNGIIKQHINRILQQFTNPFHEEETAFELWCAICDSLTEKEDAIYILESFELEAEFFSRHNRQWRPAKDYMKMVIHDIELASDVLPYTDIKERVEALKSKLQSAATSSS